VPSDNIWLSDHNNEKMQQITKTFGVNQATTNSQLVEIVDIVILAIKPQQLAQVCREIAKDVNQSRPLIVSIAAGVLTKDIESWLTLDNSDKNPLLPVVRCMPNTPALVQSGATALFANPSVNDTQKTLAESILRAAGLTLWLQNEADMDAVTAVSGSGPAYFFLVIDAIEKAAIQLGLDEKTAHLLAIQTAFGSAKMALESNDSPEILRKKGTSPGGTTEKAIAVLQEGQLEALFEKALTAAKSRSIELAQQFGDN
jgi:pyrroline-5-carboxylate reductase